MRHNIISVIVMTVTHDRQSVQAVIHDIPHPILVTCARACCQEVVACDRVAVLVRTVHIETLTTTFETNLHDVDRLRPKTLPDRHCPTDRLDVEDGKFAENGGGDGLEIGRAHV